MAENEAPRIGLLWRGDRRQEPPSAHAEQRLRPLLDALDALPASIKHVVFADGDLCASRTAPM